MRPIITFRVVVVLLLFLQNSLFAQRGKNGTLTISTANTIVNEYTSLTANASAGTSTISVAASGLNANGRFSSNLSAGDLVLIIQNQGATLKGSLLGIAGTPNDATWGSILNYNNCGNYEYLEVASVPNTTTITFTCPLQYNYTASGRVQVVRIPRYNSLTVSGSGSITSSPWNGTVGGIVAIETNQSATFNSSPSITVSGQGFRGGTVSDNNSYFGAGFYTAPDNGEGSEKGESVAGYQSDYDIYGGRYGMGSPGNAGGGGTSHNSGGGGGANGGDTSLWNGFGNPDISTAGFINAWNQEAPGFSSITSSGGGRGGYTFSNANLNATTAAGAPGLSGWGGDNRRVRGGLGGRPLLYSNNKVFFGGGGGAGDQNDGDGGPGGRGGGVVFVISHGTVSGSGTITANGANGSNADISSPPFNGYSGIDGAGGAGGGGAVIVNSTGTISGITINANGGNGGNSNFAVGFPAPSTYNPAYGPGGGGGGGHIAISNGTITRTATAGNNGTTNSSGLTEFPPNGATRGGAGTNNATINNYSLNVPNDTVTICSSGTATFTASILGTAPVGSTIYWYNSQFGSTTVATGTSFTTPTLSSNTTYYVGICPGWYRIPVTVIVSPGPTINTTSMVINNETCAGNDGSITGITVTGATSYTWNGSPSAGPTISGLTAGTYTLVASDGTCTASAGPFTVGSSGGPVIDDTNISITSATCAGNDGSINGIIVTGATSYDWNGTSSPGPNLTGASAGSYTLTVTDGSGCTTSSGPYTIGTSGGVTINTSSMVINNTTCGLNNGSITGITASGTGSLTYQWNGSTSNVDTLNATAGSYTLTVTDANSCSASAGPFTIATSSSPTINISAMVITNATCGSNNGAINGITVSGGTTPYSFTWNGINATSVDTNALGAGTYNLVVTDAAGCSATQNGIVVNSSGGAVIDDSNVNITNTTCGNNNGSITGITFSGGTNPITITYNGTNYPSTDIANLPSGNYTLQITDGSGCVSTSGPYVIDTSSSPIASAIGTDASCNGLSDGSASASATLGSGIYSYQWVGGPNTSTYSNLSAGTYSVIITDNLGCADTASVTISEPPSLNATITGNSLLCSGQSTTLTASGGTIFMWSTSETTSSITVTPASTTNYQVVVSDGACSDTATINVTVNALPVASISGDTTICDGSNTLLTANGGTSYVWSTGDTTATITYSTASSTTIFVIAANNCGTDSSYANIIVNALPSANAGADVAIALGNSTTLNGSGGTNYIWTPSTNLSCTNCQNPVANPTVTTTYTVTVTDANGCSASDDVTVTVETLFGIFVPDAFSPNGDGVNDILYVRGNGFANFTFNLYDRWGQKIFTTTDLTIGWDGTFKNKLLNEAVFIYTLEGNYLDGSSFSQKGNVTLSK